MTLRAAAYYAGWHNALDVADTHLTPDDNGAGRRALDLARFDGIATAETPDHRRRTLDAAALAVGCLLDTAEHYPSGVVERVAKHLVITDLDAAAEALTMLACLAHEWRTDALERAERPEPATDGRE